jgi:hypothetical protein
VAYDADPANKSNKTAATPSGTLWVSGEASLFSRDQDMKVDL